MEEKEVLQQQDDVQAEPVAQAQPVEKVVEVQEVEPQIDLSTQVDGEVASFDQQPDVEVVAAPPVEIPASDIAKDVKEVTAEEKAKIDEAQKKAEREYHAVFGDRQIRKPNKTIILVITIVAIVLFAFYLVTKIPMFYNCLVPTNVATIENAISQEELKNLDVGDDVWMTWYTNVSGQKVFNPMPGNVEPSHGTFADLDSAALDIARESKQLNLLLAQKQTNQAVQGDIKYVTILWYQFESVDDSKAYAEVQKAKYADGQYEHKNALFYQLGMVKGTASNYVYDAWYNGEFFIEVYATDADLALDVRTSLNYAS